MHYALVSDLLTHEEFEKRVDKKLEELGDAVDETCAAMLVVEELGRSHIKIGEIKNTTTALISFFGKILEITPPREFSRDDDSEPGVVASIILGDITGTVKLTLWDAQASAVSELEIGSVLEVIAKPRPGHWGEVNCAALRPSQVTIVNTKKPPKSELMEQPLYAKVLLITEPREIPRRDGSTSLLQEILVGDSSGTARIISWDPDIFSDLEEGIPAGFLGLLRKEDENTVEYVAGEATTITPYSEDISVPKVDAGDVSEGQTSIVTGIVLSVSPIRKFVTRRGNESQVRNIRLGSKMNGGEINIAAWNEEANSTILPGDHLEVINAMAKLNKYGEMELSVGRGAGMRSWNEGGVYSKVSGVLIPRPEGMTLDNGKEVLVVFADEPLTQGMPVTISGQVSGLRISASSVETAPVDLPELRNRLSRLL